jgi:hypothetical protein
MSLFQEYENLKAANQLLTPGSIWRDNMGEVKIRGINKNDVIFVNMPDNGYEDTYRKETFIRHFRRIR